MHEPGEPQVHRPPVRQAPRPLRRTRRWQRLSITLAALVTVVVLAFAYGTGGSPTRRAASRTGHSAAAGGPAGGHHGQGRAPAPTRAPTTTLPPTTTTTTTPAGTLPQTNAFPSSSTPQFQAEMADLWRGVVTGQVTPAMPSFFPVGAYLQLKTIPNARTDWENRLVGGFRLDIAAAHSLLGAGAASAKLVAVNVPSQYGHWVTPGTCYNSIGYYEVPNARVVYQEAGVTRSFGIASMISWRGQWYVVHLGAVLRTTATQGIVDDPATGPGTSAYSSTC